MVHTRRSTTKPSQAAVQVVSCWPVQRAVRPNGPRSQALISSLVVRPVSSQPGAVCKLDARVALVARRAYAYLPRQVLIDGDGTPRGSGEHVDHL